MWRDILNFSAETLQRTSGYNGMPKEFSDFRHIFIYFLESLIFLVIFEEAHINSLISFMLCLRILYFLLSSSSQKLATQ